MPFLVPVAEGVGELGIAAFEGTEAVAATTTATAGTAGALEVGEVLTAAQQAERLRKALAIARALAVAAAASQACQTCCRRMIIISRSASPESAQHIDEAQAKGYPSTLTYDNNKAANRARRRASIAPYPSRASENLERDEYPPAAFLENGGVADVKYINWLDNRSAGGQISAGLSGATNGCIVTIKTGP